MEINVQKKIRIFLCTFTPRKAFESARGWKVSKNTKAGSPRLFGGTQEKKH